MDELKPCQFCTQGKTVSTYFDHEQGDKWGYASCDACGARGPEVRTNYDRDDNAPWRAEAIAAWNTRADLCADPALLAEAAKVLEGVTPLVGWLRNPWSKSDSVERGPIPEWLVALLFEAAGKIEASSDLITALLARLAAQEAQIATMIDSATVQKMLEDAQPIMAEACRGYEETIATQEAQMKELEADVAHWRSARDGHFNQAMKNGSIAQQERSRAETAEAALAAERAKTARLVEAGKPFCFYSEDEPAGSLEDAVQHAWEIRYQDRFKDWIDFAAITALRAAITEAQQ